MQTEADEAARVHHPRSIAETEAAGMFDRAVFARTTGPAGETEWTKQALHDLGANGRRGVLFESHEAWMKFPDGSGALIRLDAAEPTASPAEDG